MDRDIEIPPFDLQSPRSVGGTIEVVSRKSSDSVPSGLQLVLRPTHLFDPTVRTVKAVIDPSGAIQIGGLFPGEKYSCELLGLPAGYYFESALLGGQDCITQEVEPAGELQIRIGVNGATLSVALVAVKGVPINDTIVVAVGEPSTPQGCSIISATSDYDGRAILRGLCPASYSVTSFIGLEFGLATDPTFLEAHRAGATSLTFGPREAKAVRLLSNQ